MNARAQVSLELMLLIMVMLLYVQTVTQPVVQLTAKAVQDVGSVGKTRLAFDSLFDAVEGVGVSTGDARRVLEVFVPLGARLSCDSAARSLSFEVRLEPSLEKVPACAQDGDGDDSKCTHVKVFSGGFALDCRVPGAAWQGPGWKTVSVTKANGGVVVE